MDWFLGLLLLNLIFPFEASLTRVTRQVSPIACRTNIGRKGSCVDQSRCQGRKSTPSPQCSSATGRKVVCCEGLEIPRVTIPKTCGIRPLTSKAVVLIVGGTESKRNTWPWMVALYEETTFLCGGSLINSRYVITAAHCFLDSLPRPQPRRYFVRLGEFDLTKDFPDELTMESSIMEIKIHPNYSPPAAANDIALLKLPNAVGFQPVCLPGATSNTFDGVKAVVTGWGSLHYEGAAATRLQEVFVPVISNRQCNESYMKNRNSREFPKGVTKVFLCAGLKEGGKDACQGDSGGPLVAELSKGRWTLIGIVAAGHGCGLPGYPGVYTRVTEFLSWIKRNTR